MLRSRHMHAVDIQNEITEIKGIGVMGECPSIQNCESYEYMSGIPLLNAAGIMFGHYIFSSINHGELIVDIPTLPLISPFMNGNKL